MATVKPVLIVDHPYNNGGADVYEWAAIAAGDTIEWLTYPIRADKSVHVFGAFGGIVTIQGSNETGTPANPVTLRDAFDVPLTFTAVGLREVLTAVNQIRPSPGAGVTNTTVRLMAVRPT